MRDDVAAHERPIKEQVEAAVQFHRKFADRLSRENATHLQNDTANLRTRYERIVNNTNNRVQHLAKALDHLRNFDRDIVAFEHWMHRTADTVSGFTKDAGREIGVLKKQADQLETVNSEIAGRKDENNKLNLVGQEFINNAKVQLIN